MCVSAIIYLKHNCDEDDPHKEVVLSDSLEHVNLIRLSCIEFVEYLQHKHIAS